MSKSEIVNNLEEIMCNYVDLTKVDLSYDSSLTNDIGLDSFSLISIVTEIEDRFNIRISNDDLFSFATFHDVINYISQKI
jgi:acyl carrier protein